MHTPDPTQSILRSRRLSFSAGMAGLLLVGVLVVVAGSWVFQFRNAADYPGSLVVSDHVLTSFTPYPLVRRDTSYRTADDFPVVYNYYSSGLKMGPERRAQSSCIHLDTTQTVSIIRHDMSVAVCDTSTGRMIFVNRALTVIP